MKTFTVKQVARIQKMLFAFVIFNLCLTGMASAQVTISGPASVCVGTGVHVYTAIGGTPSYQWTVSSTGAIPIVISGNNPAITVDWGSLPGVGTINVATGSGPASMTVLIGVATPSITGVFTVCVSSVQPYSVSSPVAGEDYDWVVTGGSPPVWSGTSGNVTWSGSAGNYALTLQASRPGEGAAICYSDPFVQPVSVVAPPASSPVTGGQDIICVGNSTIFYAPAPPPGMNYYNYIWTVTGSGPNVISFAGQGTSSITVTGGSTPGTAMISVSYSNVPSGNCNATSPVRNITVVSGPSPLITGPAEVCPVPGAAYSVTGSAGSGFNWSVNPASGSWYGTIEGLSVGPDITVTWNNSTSIPQAGQVTVVETSVGGCTATAVKAVTIKPSPVVIPVSDQYYCNGSIAPSTSLTSTVSGTTFTWTNNNPSIGLPASGSGTAIPSFVANNTTNVPVTATVSITPIAAGCTGQVSIYQITVYPTLIPGFISGNQSICFQGLPSQLNATAPTGGNGPYSYQWQHSVNNIDFINIGGATSLSYQPGSLTVTTWYRQVQSSSTSCGSVYTDDIQITVNPLPVPTITGDESVCINTTEDYSTESGMTGYVWSVTGGNIVGPTNTRTVTVNWTTAGIQQLTVNYTNSNGCTAASATLRYIQVNPNTTPSITGPSMSCVGYTETYSTENGMTNYSWSMSSGGAIRSGQGTHLVTVEWTTQGTKQLSVTYVNQSGCPVLSPAVKTVTVGLSPNPTITGTSAICPSSNAVVYFTEPGMSSYSWTITSGGTITDGQGTHAITVNWLSSGLQTITVNYSNGTGCMALLPGVKSVTVYTSPQPLINGSAFACTDVNSNYYTEQGKSNYQWNISPDGYIVNGLGTYSITVNWNTTGPKVVTAAYNNQAGTGGCPTITPTQKMVTVNQTPLASINGTDTVCKNGTLVFNTDPGMSLYQWTVSTGGQIVAGQGTMTVTVLWTQPGTRTISVSYTSTSPCPSMASKQVIVLPLPEPTVTGPSLSCIGGPVIEYSTTPGMVGYTWEISSGGTIVSGLGTASITVDWTLPGAQWLRLNYSSQFGCTAQSPYTKSITTTTRPVNPVITGSAVACPGTSGNIYNTQGGMDSYLWSISPGGTILTVPSAGSSSVTVSWNTTGQQWIGVNYLKGGCEPLLPATYSVTVNPMPAPTITGPAAVCVQSAGNVYNTEPGMGTYTWTVSGNGTITAGGTSTSNSVTVKWTGTGTGTVTVNYATAAGCFATNPSVYTVTVSPLPVPSITGPAVVCQNSSGNIYGTETGMTGYVWTVTGGAITGPSNAATVSVTWMMPGTQSISVSYNNTNGCAPVAASVKTVTVNTLPEPSITGPAAACLNSSGNVYTTEAGMTGYVWSVNGGIISGSSNTTSVSVTWNTLGSGTVSVNYINASGCTATVPSVRTVSVQSSIIPSITGPANSCTGHTVIYYTESGMNGYVWTVTAGGQIMAGSGTHSLTVKWNTAGSQVVSVRYTDQLGCTTSVPTTQSVTVNTSPLPTITGTGSLCQWSLGVVYFTELGMTNYTWTITPGGVITGGQGTHAITVDWTGSGTQTITVNYMNASGCNAATATVKAVTVYPVQQPVISGSPTACTDRVVGYSTEAGMTNYQWSVTSGGIILSGAGTNSITVIWNTTGLQSVSVGYNNPQSGCPTMIETVKEVTVFATPVASITGDDATCQNGTMVFTTEPGMALYQWTPGAGGQIISGQNTNSVAVKWTQAGTRTITVSYTSTSPCPSQASRGVTIFAPPVPQVTGPAIACTGGSGVVYSTETGMLNYIWEVSAGGTIVAGGGTNSITVLWNTSGQQWVKASYTNLQGCPATAPTQYLVTVNTRPANPVIIGAATTCAGVVTYPYNTASGMSSYTWSVSAGGTILAEPTGNTSSVTVRWNVAGQQWVGVTYSKDGCEALLPAIYSVTVSPMPVPTITGPAAVCVQSAGNVYNTEPGMGTYTWTVSGNGTITAGGTSTSNSVTVKWTGTGTGTVTVNYATAAGCFATNPSVYTVTVSPLPVPSITGPAVVCQNSSGNIYGTETGMTGYVWTVTGGAITGPSNAATVSVTWITPGTRTISATYTDINGCQPDEASSINVNVLPAPVPTIEGPIQVCNGSIAEYQTEAGMTDYSWTVSAGGSILAGSNSNLVTVSWATPGLKTLTVSYRNTDGCITIVPAVKTVTVRSNVVATITGPDPACTGNKVIYYTEAGMATYLWNISAGGSITQGAGTNSVTVIWNTPGTESLNVIYTDPIGCTQSNPTVKNITVNTSPLPTITGSSSICQGSPGIVYFTELGMTGYTWTCSPGGTITAGQGTNAITVNWTGSGTQTITVNYTNASGCHSGEPASKTIMVNPSPSPIINGPSIICNGNATNYSTESGYTNYQWTLSSGGSIISGLGTNAIVVNWSSVGTHYITVSYLNQGTGCPTLIPSTKTITVNPSPAPSIVGTDSTCLDGTLVFSTQPGNALYTWTVSSGYTILSGQGTNSIAVKFITPGTKIVTVNYTNTNNCSAPLPAVKTVVVYAPPVPLISGLTSACAGGSGFNYSTAAGMSNYFWTVTPGGTISAGAGTNSITVLWSVPGTQTVTLSYTDNHGCNAITPTAFGLLVNTRPLPSLTGTVAACSGSMTSTFTTDPGKSNYQWSVSAGGSILTSPTTTANSITVHWTTPGVKSIWVNYDNENNCNAIVPAQMTCTVYPLPLITLTGPANVCINSTANVYRTEPGMSNYQWTISAGGIITGGGTSASDSVRVTWITSGPQTVSVNYANSNQCMSATPKTLSVTVNPLPAPMISGPVTTCPDISSNVFSTDPGMTGYIWSVSGGGIILGGQGTQTITAIWSQAGTKTVTVNYTNNNGCTAATSTVKTVVVNPLPVPTISGSLNGCISFNSSYTTETGMTGYNWSVGPGGTIVSGVNSPTVTIRWISAGIETISLSYTNSNGCTALPALKTVTVHDYVMPTIAGPDYACTEQPVVYSTEPGKTNYVWTVSTSGVIVSGNGTQSVTVVWYSAGNQTVTVNYTTGAGCTAVNPGMKTITVTVSPVPWIDGPNQVCQASTGIVYTTTNGMLNYTWTVSPGGTITSGNGTASVTVTWTQSGLQTITVNYSDPSGCSAVNASTKTVTVLPYPVPTVTGPLTVCNGSSVVYVTEQGMTGYQWTVTPGGIITSGGTTSLITLDWIYSGLQTITVIYTGLNGCTAVQPTQRSITVYPLPVPTITYDTVACINGTNVFVTEPGMTSYQWTVSPGGIIVAGAGTNSIVVNWTTTGTKTVTVNYADPHGCYPVQLTVKTIKVKPLPMPVITGPAQACLGAVNSLYSTEPGMTNYQWAVTSGGVITSGQGTSSITVTWTSVAPQTVSVSYTGQSGCSAAAPTQYPVVINQPSVPTLTGTSVACAGSTSNLYLTDPGMTNYQWSVSAGGSITTSPTTTSNSINVTWNAAGPQYVTVNYANTFGCSVTTPTTKTVTVLSAPAPTITGVSAVCAGMTGIVYSTEPGNINYLWSVTPGGTITAGTGTNIITVSWLNPGTQTVTVNYTYANGCSAATPGMKSVTVNPLPVPTVTGNATACMNSSTTHTTQAGMTNYLWTVSAGGTIQSGSSGNSIVVQWITPGLKQVSVSYTNANGCTAAAPGTQSVTVYSLPAPTITGSTSVCTGATNITYTTEQGMVNYQWSVSAGGVITSGINTYMITVTWNSPGVQGVTVNYTDAHGCTAPVPTSLPVTVNTIPVPTISGSTSPCVTSGNYTYTTEQGMQNYVWTVSAGGIIVGGQGTRNVQIYWTASGSQSVSVGYSTLQGCISQITTLPVNVNPLPGAPGPVTGDTLICKPELGVLYFVNPIPGAIGYDWAIPAGATIVSGSNTNIITVNYGTAAQSGNISVFGVNTCGNGPYSPVLHVSVHPYPETPHVTVIEPDTLESSAPDGNQWYRNNVAIPGATAQRYVAYLPGDYFVIANPFGCPSDPSNVVGIYPVGQPETNDLSMQIYPNPADNKVTIAFGIRLKEGTLTVRMADNMGRVKHLVKDMRVHGEAIQNIDLGDPPNGIYYLLIQYGDRHFLRKLLIVNEQ